MKLGGLDSTKKVHQSHMTQLYKNLSPDLFFKLGCFGILCALHITDNEGYAGTSYLAAILLSHFK